ncbi:MAG: CYTH domain-containing protein [Arenicellales bacterium]
MTIHIEQEIKLTAANEPILEKIRLSKCVQDVLLDKKDAFEPKTFAAIYYDTPNWTLRDLRWSLRTRTEGTRHMAALKRGNDIINGLSSCEEIEQAITESFTSVGALPQGDIAQALQAELPKSTPLLSNIRTTMQRCKGILQISDTRIEMVTDAGHIEGNGQQQSLFEVELELLQGDLQAKPVQLFVANLIQQFSLTPSKVSKHQIGLAFFT